MRDQIVRNSGLSGIYRLQFWKDTLDVLYGHTQGPLPRQPVATALSLFVDQFDEVLLRNLLAARQRTLGDRPFTSLDDVKQYGIETTGSLIKLIMQLLLESQSMKCSSLSNESAKAAELMSHAVAIITLIRCLGFKNSDIIFMCFLHLCSTQNPY
ncbi:unnamed protein product [Gongylonema pulchrum]|uniref:Uncharacterized protein n=1 Tax=Gongylonema pulchrum TaxID=637853 RepID=A0A183EYT1_9BILA|nr:unnamed protein product [Gongylonema pulchrum]